MRTTWKKLKNKLGLSCAKLRFSCASQLSLDGKNPWNNLTTWTLEQIEPLNYLNCYPNSHLNLNEFHFWTKWTLELMKFLNQLSPLTTLEPNKPSNQYNPWINWTLIPTEHSNQFNPQTNWTLEPIETLVQLYVWTDWTLEPIELLNQLNPWTYGTFEPIESFNKLNPFKPLGSLNLLKPSTNWPLN